MPTKRNLHPDLSKQERQRLFEQGIRYFNRGDFFEAHEPWEEVWRSRQPEPKDFFQGLIQVSVGFFHLCGRHRPDVASRVLSKGRRRLVAFKPRCLGIDVDQLLDSVSSWVAFLEDRMTDEPPFPQLVIEVEPGADR